MKSKKFSFGLTAPLFLLAVIGINRLTGLFRTVLLARVWGVGSEAAAFELASNFTATLYECSVGAVTAAMFVPAYAVRKKQNGNENADRFAWRLMPLILAVTLLLYLPLLLFPRATLALSAGELSADALASAARSARYLALARISLSLSAPLTGILQTDRKPLLPALFYMAASLVSLPVILVFGSSLTAASLSLFLLMTDLAVLASLLWAVWRKHRPVFKKLSQPRSPLFRKPLLLLTKALGVMVFSAYLPIATLLAALFSARIGGEEALAANGYAIKWVLLAGALLSSAFHSIYYPQIAQKSGEEKKKSAKKPSLYLFLLSLAPALFLFFGAEWLLTLFYKSASFDTHAVALTARLMKLYAPSLPLLALTGILNDTAYLCGKTAGLALAGLFSLLIDCALLLILPAQWGVYAVPAAFLASSLFRLGAALYLAFGKDRAKHPDKVRLLFAISDANIGGAGRQLLNYLSHSDKEHFDITVALPENAALAPRIEAMGFPVVTCGKEASFSFSAFWQYYRLIRRYRPHILHANASLNARIAAFLAAVPVRVYTRHCVYPLSPIFRHRLPRMAVGCATALLSTSVIAVAGKAAENLYGMGISHEKVTVIENGVDPICIDREAGEAIRRQYAIAKENTVAVICGRIEPDKGISTLIEAAALLKREEQPVAVLIVGQGSEEAALKELTRDLAVEDRVHFCGFVSDISPYLNAADVYVNCSVGTEATSLAIAEAMSLSLPVIATDYGGNPDMVKDGENGILVAQGSSRSLADALTVMTDEALRRHFGKASFELYTKRYSADRMARRNEALYRNLFTQKGYTMP